jgi:hypothetical protein
MASWDDKGDPRESIKSIESNIFKVTDQIEKIDDETALENVMQVSIFLYIFFIFLFFYYYFLLLLFFYSFQFAYLMR